MLRQQLTEQEHEYEHEHAHEQQSLLHSAHSRNGNTNINGDGDATGITTIAATSSAQVTTKHKNSVRIGAGLGAGVGAHVPQIEQRMQSRNTSSNTNSNNNNNNNRNNVSYNSISSSHQHDGHDVNVDDNVDIMNDEGVSIDHSTDGEVEDGSEFSYGSEYEDEDGEDGEDDEDGEDGDDDEYEIDDEDDDEESNRNNKGCLFSSCREKEKRKNKNQQRHRISDAINSDDFDGDDDNEDDDDNYDDDDEQQEQQQQKKWKILKPVLSPIIKVYEVAKEAFILITNVDDVWDSPALPLNGRTGDRNINDELLMQHRAISDNRTSSSNRYRGLVDRSTRRTGAVESTNTGTGTGIIICETGLGGESVQHHGSNELRLQDPSHEVNMNDAGPKVSLRHKIGVLFWFLVLATAYASERGTFKVMVDRMGPFRMVVGAEIVMAVHALILALWIGIRSLTCGREQMKDTVMLPLADIGLMAILDSIQLIIAVISGSRVAPILTAVLVHFSIPVSTFMKFCLFPTQVTDTDSVSSNNVSRISSQHLFGSTLICISSVFALSPAILTLIVPTLFSSTNVMANRTAWNTILFTISCIPAAMSQIYKERTFAAFAQPVDSNLLNMLLSLFSCVFTFFVSPLLFPLQGLADTPSRPEDGSELKVKSWINQYPSKEISKDFSDALQCFTGRLSDEVQIRGYPEEAHCDFAFGFVLLYVFSIITINHAVDRICNAGAIKIMHRGISSGIILSVILMTYYQIFVDDEDYGLFPNFYHVSCAIVLVMGSEVQHRASLERPSFETEYPPVADLYDDE